MSVFGTVTGAAKALSNRTLTIVKSAPGTLWRSRHLVTEASRSPFFYVAGAFALAYRCDAMHNRKVVEGKTFFDNSQAGHTAHSVEIKNSMNVLVTGKKDGIARQDLQKWVTDTSAVLKDAKGVAGMGLIGEGVAKVQELVNSTDGKVNGRAVATALQTAVTELAGQVQAKIDEEGDHERNAVRTAVKGQLDTIAASIGRLLPADADDHSVSYNDLVSLTGALRALVYFGTEKSTVTAAETALTTESAKVSAQRTACGEAVVAAQAAAHRALDAMEAVFDNFKHEDNAVSHKNVAKRFDAVRAQYRNEAGDGWKELTPAQIDGLHAQLVPVKDAVVTHRGTLTDANIELQNLNQALQDLTADLDAALKQPIEGMQAAVAATRAALASLKAVEGAACTAEISGLDRALAGATAHVAVTVANATRLATLLKADDAADDGVATQVAAITEALGHLKTALGANPIKSALGETGLRGWTGNNGPLTMAFKGIDSFAEDTIATAKAQKFFSYIDVSLDLLEKKTDSQNVSSKWVSRGLLAAAVTVFASMGACRLYKGHFPLRLQVSVL